jgi:hypothetical protein
MCSNYKIKCDTCGRFYIPVDSEIPFGCKNYDMPEPLDERYYCSKCAEVNKKEWLKYFQDGGRYGYYMKSYAEQEAAEESDLVWVDADHIGTWGTNTCTIYKYVTKEEFKIFSNLPKYKEQCQN